MASEAPKCSICIEDLGKENVTCTPCYHTFHDSCLERWVQEKINYRIIPCPLCKHDLSEIVDRGIIYGIVGRDDHLHGNIEDDVQLLESLELLSPREEIKVLMDPPRSQRSAPHPLDRIIRRIEHNTRREQRRISPRRESPLADLVTQLIAESITGSSRVTRDMFKIDVSRPPQ